MLMINVLASLLIITSLCVIMAKPQKNPRCAMAYSLLYWWCYSFIWHLKCKLTNFICGPLVHSLRKYY